MKVQKRGIRGYEDVKFDKITTRIRGACKGLSPEVDPAQIALATIKMLYNGITTEELDTISANIAESNKLAHPDYSKLAARILVSNLHKTTPNTFSECTILARKMISIISESYYQFIMQNAAELDSMINHDNDYLFDFFGYKTLEKAYLISYNAPVLDVNGNKVYINQTKDIVPFERVVITAQGRPILLRANATDPVFVVKEKTRVQIIDRPQYMFMRVAIVLNFAVKRNRGRGLVTGNSNQLTDQLTNADLLAAIKTNYQMMSSLLYTHATPTLFNAMMKIMQLDSCFLMQNDDSIEGIMKNLTDVSLISKRAGGIGIGCHAIRCAGSYIKSTNGPSSGLPKQLKMYNEAARCWDQGGRRLGSFAIYLEPWHGDILRFLQLKTHQGDESERAKDLFYALWVPDLFVQRARNPDAWWTLFSSDTAPGLHKLYDGMNVCKHCDWCSISAYQQFMDVVDGPKPEFITARQVMQSTCDHKFAPVDAFTKLYTYYENQGYGVDVVKASEIMDAVCKMQRESGTPYISNKDHANRMSNHAGKGTIESSNLCNEIYQWSSKDSYACCTLASINLKKFLVIDGVKPNGDMRYVIDHVQLHETARFIVRSLDTVIDINDYPVVECEVNSKSLRPIAIGIQALADVFAIKRIPFLSAEAEADDLAIAETIYHAAIVESVELSKKYGPFEGFEDSPAARGLLHPDLWKINQDRIKGPLYGINPCSGRYDWNILRESVTKYGLRNSLHCAAMPTVSTSQIMGNNESFEPFPSNIYTKSTLAGKFTISNNQMITHLRELGLWSDVMKNRIINNNSSLAGITEIPADVREIYLTVWEMRQMELIRRTALRQAFYDQGMSLNLHIAKNSDAVLRGIFFAGWEHGLKTTSYYIRTRPAASAMKNNLAETRSNEKESISTGVSSGVSGDQVCYPGCDNCSS